MTPHSPPPRGHQGRSGMLLDEPTGVVDQILTETGSYLLAENSNRLLKES